MRREGKTFQLHFGGGHVLGLQLMLYGQMQIKAAAVKPIIPTNRNYIPNEKLHYSPLMEIDYKDHL